jgi:hypothetical protein
LEWRVRCIRETNLSVNAASNFAPIDVQNQIFSFTKYIEVWTLIVMILMLVKKGLVSFEVLGQGGSEEFVRLRN